MAKTNSPTTTDLPTPDEPSVENTDDPTLSDDNICHLVQQLGRPFTTIPTVADETPYTYEHMCERLRNLAAEERLTRVNAGRYNRAYYALGQIDPSEFNEDEHILSTGNLDVDSPDTIETVQNTLDDRIVEFEKYWRAVDAKRLLGPVLLESDATVNDTETSPLAAAYVTARDRANELRETCHEMPTTLPAYRDAFTTPQFDHRQPTTDEFDRGNIELNDEDDPIHLPADFTIPPVWDETDADEDNESADARDDTTPTEAPSDDADTDTETISVSLNIELNVEIPTDTDITVDEITIE